MPLMLLCLLAPPPLRVMTYNIRHGEGLDGQIDLERIAEVIRAVDPDVACLQEVDQGVARTGRVDQPAELARLTGLHTTFGGNLKYQGGDYGNLILSRAAPLRQRNLKLPLEPGAERRGCLMVELPYAAGEVSVACTHLALEAEVRQLEVAAILAELDPARPAVLAGDLNERPDGPAVARLLEVFADSFDARRDGPGQTFPASAEDRRIDYLLHSPRLAAVAARVVVEEPARVASDHLPYVAEFVPAG